MLHSEPSPSCTDGDLIEKLRCKQSVHLRERNVSLMLKGIKRDFARAGAAFHPRVNAMYAKYRSYDMVVRRENPEAVINCIMKGEPIEIDFDPAVNNAAPYPNCSMWNPTWGPAGLQNALYGGFYELGGITFVIGFKAVNCTVHNVKLNEENIRCCCNNPRFMGDPRLYRCISGKIELKDIYFILVCTPPRLFPEDEVEDDSEYDAWNEESVPFILRGFGL